MIKVLSESNSRTKIIFSYNPIFITRIKTIHGIYWHAYKKYWSVPNSKDVLTLISKNFSEEKVYIDPALQTAFLEPISLDKTAKQINKAQVVKSDDSEEIPILEQVRNLIRLKDYSIPITRISNMLPQIFTQK